MTNSLHGYSSNGKSLILLVENDAISSMVTKNILESLNCEVITVTSGEAALAGFKYRPYDLILMDIGLASTMDGIAATKQIRLYEMGVSHAQSVPIVGLSAIQDVFIKSKCYAAGMNSIIMKPLNKESAHDILQKFVFDKNNTNSQNLTQLASVSGKIVDINTLMDLIEKNKDHEKIKIMIDESISRFPDRRHALEVAYEKGDWKKIHDIALELSGESTYFGMERLKLACGQLMENINAQQYQYVDSMYNELLCEITLAIQEYHHLKEKNLV